MSGAHGRAALAALAATLFGLCPAGAPAASERAAAHSFDLTYRGFGPVVATRGFQPSGPVLVRFEGCYAKDGPEAICGFTLRALRHVVISNRQNLSHGSRSDGAPMRTCCLFQQGRPEGFPIVATQTDAVADLAATVEPGHDLGVMLRLPDYRTGAPLRTITFARGEADPGVTFPATVRRLP